MDPLRKIILIALGHYDSFNRNPRPCDWALIVERAEKQRVLGIVWKGIQALPEEQKPPVEIAERLEAIVQSYAIMHETHRQQCHELRKSFSELGFRSCIIKGEAFARYYPERDLRHCGDIDVWVEGEREKILKALRDSGHKFEGPLYQECEVAFFKSTLVDVHFHPAKMFNPFRNKRLQKFYDYCAHNCFKLGHTTVLFDIVHCLVHIFRHALTSQITYHQLMDLYYILLHATSQEKAKALRVIKSLGLRRFTANVMYALGELFELGELKMLCYPSKPGRGRKFLRSVKGKGKNEDRHSNRILQHWRNLPAYPGELVWAPVSRTWQFICRKLIYNRI